MTRVTGTERRPRTGLSVDLPMRARLRAGDAAAFGRLFDEHARTVYRHAVRVTAD